MIPFLPIPFGKNDFTQEMHNKLGSSQIIPTASTCMADPRQKPKGIDTTAASKNSKIPSKTPGKFNLRPRNPPLINGFQKNWLPSRRWTYTAPEKLLETQQERPVFQPPFFRGKLAVQLRGCRWLGMILTPENWSEDELIELQRVDILENVILWMTKKSGSPVEVELRLVVDPLFTTGFYAFQVVQHFFHQQ